MSIVTSLTATDFPYDTVRPSMSKTVSRFVVSIGACDTGSEVIVLTVCSVDGGADAGGAEDVNDV